MRDDEIRVHIEAAAARGARETHRVTRRIVEACWPGGSGDRTEPAALAWLHRWNPTKLGAKLPVCSCSRGRCLVCN